MTRRGGSASARRGRPLPTYLIAVVAPAIPVSAPWFLSEWLPPALALIALVASVAVTASAAGRGLAAVASGLGYLGYWSLFILPSGVPWNASSMATLMVYLLSCGAVSYVASNRRDEIVPASAPPALPPSEIEVLRRRERELADFFDHASVGMHWIAPDGTILRTNRAELQMLGYEPGEYVGHHVSEFHTDHDFVDDMLTRVANGESLLKLPARIRCKDGSIKEILLDCNGLWEGGALIHSRCITVDVTDRRQSEAKSALLAAIVTASDDAIVSKTLDGIILSWNEGAERVFGYTSAEAVGQSIDLIVPHDLRDEERSILERLRKGDRIDHFETARVAKSGERLNISLTVSPLRNDRGAVVGASSVARDVTERKRAEEALRNADRRKDEFLATLAHELRNPLAPIRHSLEILKRAERDSRLRHQALDIIARQLAHMVRLVDDLLDVSRITQDKLELRRTRVELGSMVNHAIESARPLLEQNHHVVELTQPERPIFVHADPVRLTQVLSNLVNNASQYTHQGGVIWATVTREEGEVAISVKDSGIGIPPHELQNVFELFAQGGRRLEPTSDGLGIGLTLAKRLVDLHGGTVTARSDGPGLGSEFVVRLPLLESAEPTDTVPIPTLRDVPPRRVLVVDDNADSAESLATLLELSGHHTRMAHDGLAAVVAASEFLPDVVLLDLGLPKLSGIEACRRIRSRSWGKRMIVVALTGWGQEHDRCESREAGFDGHLVKPVAYEDLQQFLAQVPSNLAQ